MLNKKIMVLAIFFVSLLAISAVSAADNATSDVVGVEKTTDEVVSVENDENGNILKKTNEENNTLKQANNPETDSQILSKDEGYYQDLINELDSWSVVLSHKYYKIDRGNTIIFDFRKSCDLDGNGATIDMNGENFALFEVNGRVTFKNLIFKNLNAEGEGGVIRIASEDAECVIVNCTFDNNHDSTRVGAILIGRAGKVGIINCTFVNNAGGESGAIYFYHHATKYSIVENCTFIDNSASSGKSAIGGNIGSVSINDNWWGSNNPNWQDLIDAHVPERYAVLICSINATTITVGSKAKLNYAFYRNGTADRLSLPARQIKLSTTGGDLDKTSGDLINEFSTEFSSNTPGYYEITATVDNEKIKIPIYVINKIIYVNSSVDSSGDGKTNETPFKTLKEALDVAEDYDTIMIAAGTYTGSNNVDLTIEKNNLIFNKCGDGEAIFDAQGDFRIWTVNTSSSTIININGLIFKNGNAKSGNYGGAIYFKNNVVDSNINADFINNTAMYGGAIYYSGKVTDSSLSGICINNTETSVIYLDGESENSVIHDAVFINNYNNIYVKSGTINVTNCWFGNNATNYNEKPDIGVDLNDWLFLNATAEPGEIKLGQSSTITFKLYNKNSPAAEYDASKMNIVLDLNQTLGELDKTTVSLGEKTSYTSKESGNASVTGKFETAYYTINLKNKPKIPVDIILENETIDLEVGDEVSAGATLNPPVGNLTYTSSNESVVIVENGVIKAVGEGTANVTVSFNGTDEYAAAERNITVCVLSEAEWYYMADGRINNLDGASGLILPFGVYTCVVLDSNGQPLSKGLNVNIKLNDDYIINATVGEDGMFDLDINGIKTGKYTATFSSYGYAHAVASFFIVKKQTDITLENSTMALKINDIVSSGATLNSADAGDLTYTSSNSSVAIVENGKIKAIAIGTAVITVSFSGNANYYATKNKTIEVTVSKIPTEITVQNSTLDMKVGDGTVIVATLTPVGEGNVTFTSSNESVVEVDDEGNVLAQGKGQAIITVSFAGNNNCTAAENKTVTVTVSLNDASVTVDNNTLDLKIGEKYAINATKHPDTIVLDITYASSNRSVATVDRKGIVTAVGEGTAVITVEVGEDVIYAKNSTNVTVTVSKIPTEITVDTTPLDLFVGDEIVIVANLTPAGAGNVTFTSSDYDVVDFDFEGNVIAQGKGQAIITVSFAGDDKYAAAENKTIIINVSLDNASVTVDNNTLDLKVGETSAINATKHPDTIMLDITYTSSNNSVVTVDKKGIVTAVGEGTAVITVEVGDDEIYAKNSTNVTVTVSKIPTEITLTNATLDLKVNEIVDGLANLTPADAGNLTFISSDENIVFVADGKILARSKGNATVTVSFAGNDKYAAALNRTIHVNVSLKDASVSVENDTLKLKVDERYDLNATAVPSFLNVEYVSSNESVATVTDYGIVTAVGEGTATITLTVGNDVTYAVNSTNVTVTVSKIPTEITLTNATLDLKVDDEVKINATLTPSEAGELDFTSSDVSVVTVNSIGEVTAVGEGVANVTVRFMGNNKYAAAENKTIEVTVSLNDANVSVNNSTLDLTVGDTFTIVATTTPDNLNVTYIPDNSCVVSVDEKGKVTALKEGNATIVVKVGGDGVYAENTTNVTVSVSKIPTEIILLNDTLDLKVLVNITLADATLNPAEAGDLTYTSSNSSVVTLIGNLIIPIAQGNAVITVSFAGNDKYAAAENRTIDVTVTLNDAKVTVDNSTLDLKIEDTYKINATTVPEILKLFVNYTSSNESVVTVDKHGEVTAVGEGNAIITVSVGDGAVFAKNSTQVQVTVSLKDATVNVNNSTLDLTVGDTFDLVATTNPDGLNVTYVPDNSGVVSVDENGKVTALKTGKAIITVKITPNGVYAENSTNVTVKVNKIPTEITSSAITTVFNVYKDLVITLKDVNGTPISGASLTVDLFGAKTYTTDANGQVNVSTVKKIPNTYTAKITFNGNSIYDKSSKNVKVTLKKGTPKITAKTKTFKVATKVKKYTITLKNNLNKAMTKSVVYLKVGGKTYKAHANSQGKATFKITKLNKKGTFKATITYKGNSYYNKVTKKATIKVVA